MTGRAFAGDLAEHVGREREQVQVVVVPELVELVRVPAPNARAEARTALPPRAALSATCANTPSSLILCAHCSRRI